MSPPPPSSEFDRLRGIMAKLRDPETGCPWDVEQSFSSISPYTIEEAYEVADAIEREDYEDLRTILSLMARATSSTVKRPASEAIWL